MNQLGSRIEFNRTMVCPLRLLRWFVLGLEAWGPRFRYVGLANIYLRGRKIREVGLDRHTRIVILDLSVNNLGDINYQ